MASFFPAGQMAQLRSFVATSLPDSAVIQRPTSTVDAAGSEIRTYTNVGTVACRVEPDRSGDAERTLGERLTGVLMWRVTLPYLTDITAPDRISINGRMFEVEAVLAPESYEARREVVATELLPTP